MPAVDPRQVPPAERLELDYVRRPQRVRPRRWRTTVGIAVLTVLLLTAAHLWSGKRIYQAGPVADVHAMFGNDCAQCHDREWRTGLRLFLGDLGGRVRSVSDTACQRCHEGGVHNAKEATHASCASCHHEHVRQTPLVRVADGHCISCHRNLEQHLTASTSTTFQPRVSAFAEDHPEFALWRTEGHKDPGSIRFNHAVHLAEEGVFTLAHGAEGVARVRKRLDCQACHTPDAAGLYMQPIRYEKHCQECHPLSVQLTGLADDAKDRQHAEAFRAEPAPHQPPLIVRGVLRERLNKQWSLHGVGKPTSAPAAEAPVPPGQRRTPPVAKEQLEWVNGQLREIERVLFNLDGGCRYCHAYEPGRTDGLPQVKAARVNEREWPGLGMSQRWLPHSKFSHESHRLLDCRECHAQAPASKETSDMLLPRVANCQACHQPATNVRSDCVLCHTYHPAGARHAFRGTMRIEDCVGRIHHPEPANAKRQFARGKP